MRFVIRVAAFLNGRHLAIITGAIFSNHQTHTRSTTVLAHFDAYRFCGSLVKVCPLP